MRLPDTDFMILRNFRTMLEQVHAQPVPDSEKLTLAQKGSKPMYDLLSARYGSVQAIKLLHGVATDFYVELKEKRES